MQCASINGEHFAGHAVVESFEPAYVFTIVSRVLCCRELCNRRQDVKYCKINRVF